MNTCMTYQCDKTSIKYMYDISMWQDFHEYMYDISVWQDFNEYMYDV